MEFLLSLDYVNLNLEIPNPSEAGQSPALRATMGDWVYYVTTMRLCDVAERIDYAHEIHSNKELSDLIQRRLDSSRGKTISNYLLREKQRFFNAMVVGVYGGNPSWYDFAEISPQRPGELSLPSDSVEAFGFLGFTGKEKLFALDGQHRLSGIKQAVKTDVSEVGDDQIAIIFVGHQKDEEGLQRTRRLFTVLNKTARPVLKGDIIALDEDDVMAICVRRLLNQCRFFNRGQVAMRLQNSLPPSDKTSWTTITMMYDMLTVIFRNIYPKAYKTELNTLEKLKNERPSEEVLNHYFEFAVHYFEQFADSFTEIDEVFRGTRPSRCVERNRNERGGNILFRPLGQKIFVQIVAELSKCYELKDIFEWLSLLPTDLSEPPYANVIWNTGTQTMSNSKTDASIVRDILLYMLGEETRILPKTLAHRYAQYLGQDPKTVKLPSPLVEST